MSKNKAKKKDQIKDDLVHRVNFLQSLVDELILPPDCRAKTVNADFDYIKKQTEKLLKKASK